MSTAEDIARIFSSQEARVLLSVVNLVYLGIFTFIALLGHVRSREKRGNILLWVAGFLALLALEYVIRIRLDLAGRPASELFFVQAHTSSLFAIILLVPAAQILRMWQRHRGIGTWLRRVFWSGAGITVVCGVGAALRAWVVRTTVTDDPDVWLKVLRVVAPGTSLLVFGLVFWGYFYATRSTLGQGLGGSVFAYGLLQFSEALPISEENAFLLFLALILKTLFAFSVVLLGITLSDRRKIVEYFEQSSLGIGLCTRDDASGDLQIRLPNLKMRQILKRENTLRSSDFSELWGPTLSAPSGSLDFLASFKRDSALYRFFLIPAPYYFMGTSHLLLAYELESILGSFRDVNLGLIIAGRPTSEPERSPIDLPVLWCNRSVEDLLERRQGEIVGTAIREFIHPDWRGLVRGEDASPTTDNLVALTPREPGHAGVLVRLTTSVLPAPGNPQTELSLIVVTDRARATRTHTQILLRNFQHNLRNPLESLKVSLESLRHEGGTPGADHLSAFLAKVARVSRVVRLNLQVGQDLAREEHAAEDCEIAEVLASIGASYAEHRPEDLFDIVRGDPARLGRLRTDDGRYLDIKVRPGDSAIRIDRGALETVLIELADNALRRSHTERPKIEARPIGDGWLELEVTNDLKPETRWIEDCEQGRLSTTSQGLTCVRMIAIRWGWHFQTTIERDDPPRFRAVLAVPRQPPIDHSLGELQTSPDFPQGGPVAKAADAPP